jgi:hypothetical protein
MVLPRQCSLRTIWKCKYPLRWNSLYEKNNGTTDGLDADLPDEERMSQTRQRIMEVIEAVLQRNQPPLNGTLMREKRCNDTPRKRAVAGVGS